MDAGYSIEVAVNLFLQSLGTWSFGIMKAISFLGQEEFFLILMPFLYWCVDSRIGLRVGLMLLLSNGVNGFFKVAFAGPRPYWFDGDVQGVIGETSFGNPSGHAQIAASVWGYLAALFRKKWFTILAFVVIFLVGLSRLFLGVHFLRDVLIGWFIGALMVFLFIKVEPFIVRTMTKLSYPKKIGYTFVLCAILLVILLIPYWFRENFVFPQSWMTNALADVPNAVPEPLSKDGVFTVTGTILGMLLGYIWLEHKFGGMNNQGTPGKVLLRFLIGLIGVALLWFGLGQIFPRDPNILSYGLRLLRYALIGLWVSAFAPWLFIKLKLAKPAIE
ncbi:MAG: phosphatase PAP2 family protein [Anaerolineaceae bacterium]